MSIKIELQKKKKRYLQKYSKQWESNVNFCDWLTSSDRGVYYAYCSACNVDLTLNAGVTDIRKHSMGKKHIKKMAALSQPASEENLPYVHDVLPDFFCERGTKFASKRLNCEDEDVDDEMDDEDSQSSVNIGHEYTNKPYCTSKGTKKPTFHNDIRKSSIKKSSFTVREDELDIFGKHVAAQLRKLPEDYTVGLILEIQSLITQSRLKAITEQNSQVQVTDFTEQVALSLPNGSLSS